MVFEKFSRRTLFALLLCFVALLGAFGAYAYMLNNQPSVELSRTAVSDGLILEMDKTVYELGENVTITFTNNSTEAVAFPDYGWFTIKDSEDHLVAPVGAMAAVLRVPTEESLTYVWDQLDHARTRLYSPVFVPPGIYTVDVTVYTADLAVIVNLSVSFQIVG